MKKLFLTIILSLSLFSLENEVKATREITGIEAFLCAGHPRLGAASLARKLDQTLQRYICSLAVKPFLKITNYDLQDFNGLIQRLRSHFITKLDLSETNITTKQLCDLLRAIGGTLKELNLRFCSNLSSEYLASLKQTYPNITIN